jgi:hypothetical protein
MHKFWEKLEHYNAKLIPPAIVILFGIIIFELFLHIENHTIETIVHVLDVFVIAVFVIDLTFLAIKAKGVKFFFKKYWLDILAIFPFTFVFGAVAKLYRGLQATQRLILGQAILHESLEARKGVQALARSGRIGRFIRIGARSIRVITKSRLFTKVKAKHHLENRNHKNGKKTTKKKAVKKKTVTKKNVKKKTVKKTRNKRASKKITKTKSKKR